MFLVDNHCDTLLLKIGGSCTVDVAFRPIGRGTVNGEITITSVDLGEPYAVGLTGNGISWFRMIADFFVDSGVKLLEEILP